MTDVRKRLGVSTFALLALALSGLLIGQAVATNERVIDANADNSFEQGVPLPDVRAPQGTSLSDDQAATAAGDEGVWERIPQVGKGLPKGEPWPASDGIPAGVGNDPTDPFVIAALPYSHSGDNTTGASYFDGGCEYGPGTPGVADYWYTYTPAANGCISITLCNTPSETGDIENDWWIDLMVFIFDNGYAPANQIACNDDNCRSWGYDPGEISSVKVRAGHTYYIAVEGGAGAPGYIPPYGPYVLDVQLETCPPDDYDVICADPSTQPEVELCGERINGGTYGNPTGTPPWPNTALAAAYTTGQLLTGNIPAPAILCGHLDLTPEYSTTGAAFNGTSRDADSWRWRQVGWQKISLTFKSEIPCGIFIVSLGNGATAGTTTNLAFNSGIAADVPYTVTLLLQPNYWYSFNLRAAGTVMRCGENFYGGDPRYYITTTDIPLAPIDDCPLGYAFTGDTEVGTPIVIDMTGMTDDGTYTYPGYGTQPYLNNAWIHWTCEETGEYTISGCTTPNVGDPLGTFDLYMGVHRAPCMSSPANQKGFSDDGDACPGYEPEITGFIAVNTFDYNISIGNWAYPTVGPAWIEISHIPIPLYADNCAEGPMEITGDTYAAFFNNLNATLDAPDTTDCNAHQFGGDIWYKFTAWETGYAYARWCDANYDVNMEVYEGDVCPTQLNKGTLIRCNDDGCPQLLTTWPDYHGSATSWPVVTGEKYLIRIGGWYNPPANPLELGGMGFGWYDMFITAQPDTLRPANDDCVDMTPAMLSNGVPITLPGDNFYVTRNDCLDLDVFPPNHEPECWEAFTVPVGGCMDVQLDFFGSVDVFNNNSRYGVTTGDGICWTGCPCEGDFFALTSTYSCLNNAAATPCVPTVPGGDFNNVHFFRTMPPGDYWTVLNYTTIGLLEHEFAYNAHITGTSVACVCCAAGANTASCIYSGATWLDRIILRIDVDTLINNTVAGTGCHGYQDFTAVTADVYRGFNYNWTLRYGKVGGSPTTYVFDTLLLWIDWNQNSAFFDPSDIYRPTRPTVPISSLAPQFFQPMLVPMDAALPGVGYTGQTRVRVRVTSTTSSLSYCGSPTWGEVEDYLLIVKDLECGDFNIDGNRDGTDIAFLKAYYFGSGPAPDYWQRGDIDGDGFITIADIIALADAAYRGGPLNCM